MSQYVQVVTTLPTQDEARRVARALIDLRLAACVQIVGPIESIYPWQGQVETSAEWQCWAKTTGQLYPALEQEVLRLHPYEVPEVLAMPVISGSRQYLQWLDAEVAS